MMFFNRKKNIITNRLLIIGKYIIIFYDWIVDYIEPIKRTHTTVQIRIQLTFITRVLCVRIRPRHVTVRHELFQHLYYGTLIWLIFVLYWFAVDFKGVAMLSFSDSFAIFFLSKTITFFPTSDSVLRCGCRYGQGRSPTRCRLLRHMSLIAYRLQAYLGKLVLEHTCFLIFLYNGNLCGHPLVIRFDLLKIW